MLKEFLKKNKVSAYQLAKETKIPYTTLNDIINGKTDIKKITSETLYRLSKATGISMEDLYEGCANDPVFYLYNEERRVYFEGNGIEVNYLGPKNLLSFHRVNCIKDDTVYVNTYFCNKDGKIYEEEDYIDLRDLLKEYQSESALNCRYKVLIGRPNRPRKQQIMDEALLVSDNLAFLYKENSLDEVEVEIVNLTRNSAKMELRLKDYAVLTTNMSKAMQKRALETAERNREQIIEEVEARKVYA